MTAIIREKLEEIFFEAVMRNHPGGVVTAAGSGSLFLPDPDHNSSAQIMTFANMRLQEHRLLDIAATAFAMIDGNPRICGPARHHAPLSRSMVFAGSTITLRWNTGIQDGWTALKFKISSTAPAERSASVLLA